MKIKYKLIDPNGLAYYICSYDTNTRMDSFVEYDVEDDQPITSEEGIPNPYGDKDDWESIKTFYEDISYRVELLSNKEIKRNV